ncbi:MAG: hypothetical protein OSJ74_07735, partial [Clostridia bacterium]|nr:hypothetical protein [Clostridia bacterium]
MYGTSKMRAVTLNNGGIYGTSSTTSAVAVQDSSHPFARFTMPASAGVAGSLYDFIETPENMKWQEFESSLALGDPDPTDYENDAWSTDIPASNYIHVTRDLLLGVTGYDNWKTDKLWLPSLTEMGYNPKGSYRGLWQESEAVFGGNTVGWSRSAACTSFYHGFNTTGNSVTVGGVKSVRPAFHLNLYEAEKASTTATPKQGEKVKDYYSDSDIDFELLGVNLNKVDITYKVDTVSGDTAGTMTIDTSSQSNVVPLQASKAGKYTVTVMPKGGECWSDGSVTPKEYVYKIVYQIATPTFYGSAVGEYSGVKQEFKFSSSYDKSKVTITPTTVGLEYEDSVGDYGGLKAKAVGEYQLKAELKNDELMEWTDKTVAAKNMSVEITPHSMILDFEPTKVWSWANGEEQTVSIIDGRFTGDTLSYKFAYTASDGNAISLQGKPDDTNPNKTNVTIPPLTNGNYTFTVELSTNGDGKNYKLSGQTARTFSVTNKDIILNEADIIWQYQNVNIDDGNVQNVGAWTNSDAPKEFEYNAAEYTFDIDKTAFASLGITIDKYENEVGKICGSYTTTVTIVPTNASSTLNGGASATFSIKWKINQGLYDLNKVYWDYTADGLGYNGRPQKVELKGLLDSLQPMYTGNRESNVGDNYKAQVQFNNDDPNFKTPIKGDRDTYKYDKDGEDFPWELEWKIVKGKITVVWEARQSADVNGRGFTYYVAGGADADKLAESLIYRQNDYDNATGTATGSSISVADIVLGDKRIDNYWVVAQLKSDYADNYEIAQNKARLFSVGSLNDEVRVQLNEGNYEFIYDGTAHGVELKVTASALRIEDIIKKYYKLNDAGEKEEELADAPVNAGKYVLEMSLSESDAQDFELTTPSINFEIKQKEIEIEFDGGKLDFTYDGKPHGGEFVVKDNALDVNKIAPTYYKDSALSENKLDEAPINSGSYVVVFALSGEDAINYKIKTEQIEYAISKVKVVAVWNTSGSVPVISNLDETQKGIVGYIYYDSEGNELADGAQLEQGKTYKVKAIIKEEYKGNYEFVGEDGETALENPTATSDKEFTVGAGSNGNNGGGIGGIGGIEDIENIFKDLPLWQLIVSGLSIILLIAFMAKIASCENKRKKANKKIEKYRSYYAGAFLGLTFGNWTAIACSLAGGALVGLIGMLIAIHRQSNAEEELEDAKDEYEKTQKKEDMKMMFMSMMGGQGNMQGQPQGVYMNAQPYLGAEDIRGIVSETMTAMLPGMQQLLPQQASSNDELVQKLIDQNEKLMQKLAEQPTEKVIEREVAVTSANDDTIKQMMKNQEALMEKILELSANQNIQPAQVQPQIIEKIVEVPVEKIV